MASSSRSSSRASCASVTSSSAHSSHPPCSVQPAAPDTAVVLSNKYRTHPSHCLFVANLAISKPNAELHAALRKLFQRWNCHSVKVLRDYSDRPYAFVHFHSIGDASNALKAAHGSDLLGHSIRCEPASINRTFSIAFASGQPVSDSSIRDLCATFGYIEQIVIPTHAYSPSASAPYSTAYVQFGYRDDAISAYATLRDDPELILSWCKNINPDVAILLADPPSPSSVIVGHFVNTSLSQADARDLLEPYGPIISCQVVSRFGKFEALENPRFRTKKTSGHVRSLHSYIFASFGDKKSVSHAIKGLSSISVYGSAVYIVRRDAARESSYLKQFPVPVAEPREYHHNLRGPVVDFGHVTAGNDHSYHHRALGTDDQVPADAGKPMPSTKIRVSLGELSSASSVLNMQAQPHSSPSAVKNSASSAYVSAQKNTAPGPPSNNNDATYSPRSCKASCGTASSANSPSRYYNHKGADYHEQQKQHHTYHQHQRQELPSINSQNYDLVMPANWYPYGNMYYDYVPYDAGMTTGFYGAPGAVTGPPTGTWLPDSSGVPDAVYPKEAAFNVASPSMLWYPPPGSASYPSSVKTNYGSELAPSRAEYHMAMYNYCMYRNMLNMHMMPVTIDSPASSDVISPANGMNGDWGSLMPPAVPSTAPPFNSGANY
ncbi:hypothetical protein CANCADRAFT_75067 [Tortispora caseinolytica NRRL Y-17796]|uniref:RRM domain-containing protein n=1 Tax=Tortispora caseinolytica NRRL Y-17796 TaxID=767744 RepID=A0A1E4TJ68_9ASCO|nr:hypothetical protein CANCADRAFT_75067 [Tortispora caseinolytica NRRL Y-17796]